MSLGDECHTLRLHGFENTKSFKIEGCISRSCTTALCAQQVWSRQLSLSISNSISQKYFVWYTGETIETLLKPLAYFIRIAVSRIGALMKPSFRCSETRHVCDGVPRLTTCCTAPLINSFTTVSFSQHSSHSM